VHVAAVPLVGCILLAGCSTTQLNKHAVAVSTSLAPVVDQASAAYRDAVALHNQRAGYEAVVAYQNKDATYDPRNAPVLLSEKEIQTRLAVLAALQVYSKSLIELTHSTDSSELDAASKSVGSNLTSLGNDLAPSVESVLGIAASQNGTTTTVTTVSGSTTTTTTSSAAAPALSPEVRNGISAAVNALGQFFVSRTVEKELPAKIEAMDPHIQLFCKTLDDDIHALDSIEQRDYDRILNLEKQFILQDEQSASLNPQSHRAQIMQLPAIAREQKEVHARLSALHDALNNFALTHHALAAAAQNNNPESLKDKLSDLAGAGSSLGNFYSSLPSK
jgi:outer membrane murein-binding lipoprotein Lpp